MALSVLIVEDERSLAKSIATFLTRKGHSVATAEDGEQGWQQAQQLDPQFVILDSRLPRMAGIDLLRKVRQMNPATVVMMTTAYGTVNDAVEAMKLGAFDYLEKPVDMERLQMILERAEEHFRLRQEIAYYRERERPILVGQSPTIQRVFEKFDQLATLGRTASMPTILLLGETGTGKGVVARLLHERSDRRDKPFVEVNSLALPPTLIEAELFGYERGAFTDAKTSRIGLFEAAEGGTLFLDEIGDLPLPLQGKLLAAIEKKIIRRIGSVIDRKVDVWIITATNRDLDACIKDGTFRADLFYRISGMTIPLLPLRDRGDDILLLARYFARTASKTYGKPEPTIGEEAAEALRRYHWPGNVRELSHAVEQAVLWAAGETLHPEDFPFVRTGVAVQVADASGEEDNEHHHWNLHEMEKRLIEKALRHTDGNISQAARLLGITRDILRYRIEKYRGLSSSH